MLSARRAVLSFGLVMSFGCMLAAQQQAFVGHWGFDFQDQKGRPVASWLGIKEQGGPGKLDIWWQPTGGHVINVSDYKVDGKHLTLHLPNDDTWDLDASGTQLTGKQTKGGVTTELTGMPEPSLKRAAPKAWSAPKPLFDGKDLQGWTPIGDTANNHWVVQGGELLNEKHGANLRSDEKFTDYKLHFEVNCPDNANSGFYQRGRYELQLEYEEAEKEPAERSMGAIYGRIPPSSMLPRKMGQWETFDVTLVGRTITVKRNGVLTIDRKVIEGITGGALDADEGQPGSFYIQGDHTGGLRFRNITVSVPQS